MHSNVNTVLRDAFLASMNLDQLRYFLLLADKLHFWQTAEQLPLSQSALSRHIQRLEAELGFRLLERTPRQVRLTAAGQLLRPEWSRLLRELDAVHRHARQISTGEVGSLRIGHVGAAAAAAGPLHGPVPFGAPRPAGSQRHRSGASPADVSGRRRLLVGARHQPRPCFGVRVRRAAGLGGASAALGAASHSVNE